MRYAACALFIGTCLAGYAQDTTSTPVLPMSLEARISSILNRMTVQEKIEQLYYKTDGNARLGVPQFTGSDGPHGIRGGEGPWSCFPTTIAMTATWEPDLIRRVGKAISLEQASRARHRIAGPVLDLLHDPRNGRASETIGEDPFLGGRISEAFVLGQNETAVFGSIKHYNLNTYETNREKNDYLIDQRSLVEFWGAHWKRAIQYGGAMSVMCAYNLVNGDKCAENQFLIKTLLRDLWGFEFYSMCDWGGFWSTSKALKAELDFCEGNDLYYKELPGMAKDGSIDMALIDNAVRNILRTKILAGMLDGQPAVDDRVRDSHAHRALVYESGVKGMVLLKNQDDILPLSKKIKSIAVIGPNADVLPLDGHSSSAVTPFYRVTPKAGIEAVVDANRVTHVVGCEINNHNRDQFPAAMAAAKAAEVVVFVGGLDNTIEGEGYFIGGDRLTGTVDLPGVQNELINKLAAVNPNIVVVVISGGTCAVNKVVDHIKGLIYAFYPGQEGGRALADILFGRVNPSGKLPVTMPKNDDQLPERDMDFRNVVTQGVGYRWYDSQKITPEFAFGFGLSYTTFKYSHLIVTPTSSPLGSDIRVQAEVTNTGKRSGEEIAQLYLSTGSLVPNLPMPIKQLKGFHRIFLKPGETKRVTFHLTPEELYIYDAAQGRYRVPTGFYHVHVGGSSCCLPLEGQFTLTPAEEKPDLIIRNIRSMPPFPKAGDKVVFLASILNRGTGPSPAGEVHRVIFKVNGRTVSWSESLKQSVPVGGMSLASGTSGPDGRFHWMAQDGTNLISATVDEANRMTETNEDNNTERARLAIPNGKLTGMY